MCAFVPVTDVLQHPRALTGIHVDPSDDRVWRIGTEAYAPPEIFYPGAEGYDASKFDVWSLGCILFVMLLVDVLDIIQVPEQDGMSKRTTMRMPFVSYNCVTYPWRNNETGACPNLVHMLDDPPVSFSGELRQPAPSNENFWRHFPKAAQRLSPEALDLLNRMLVKNPDQRIELADVQRHPWMEMHMPSKEDVRHEMSQRAPTGREIEGDQRIVLAASQQWISLGELRRSLRCVGAAPVPFPKDTELSNALISCGPVGNSDYRAVWMFTALSQYLNSLGAAAQNFSKRLLSLSCATAAGPSRQFVEQFVAQVLVIRGEVLILLLPGMKATEFPIWNDRIRMFARNQASLVAQMHTSQQQATGGAIPGGGHFQDDCNLDAPAGHDDHQQQQRHRNVRPRLADARAAGLTGDEKDWPCASGISGIDAGHGQAIAAPAYLGGAAPPAAGDITSGGNTTHAAGAGQPPSAWTAAAAAPGDGGESWPSPCPLVIQPAPAFPPQPCGSGGGGTPSMVATSAGGAGGRDIDWSWPPMDHADRALAEMTFDHQMGLPRGGCLWLTRFLDFCDVRDGIPRLEAEAVWTLVVPSGTQAMNREQWVRARYILKGLSQGRAMPPRFPEHVFSERPFRPLESQLLGQMGTRENPIRYDYFACLFRPMLEDEYRRRQTVYRKTSPVLVLTHADRSPFVSRLGSVDVDKFLLCNMGGAQRDTWYIKETNFLECYQDLPSGGGFSGGCLSDNCITAADGGVALRDEVMQALVASPMHASGLPAWSLAEWEALRRHMLAEKEKVYRENNDDGAPLAWRLALPRNHVVAVRLTDELLAGCLAHLRISYRPGSVLYREETYHPYASEFSSGDFAVSDVAAAGSGAGVFAHAKTHDRAWVWKPLNKVFRGQTLITRTITAATFQATYKELDARGSGKE